MHTTSTLSGLLFVALCVVFVLFDGAAALLTSDTRVGLSVGDTIAALGAHVPDAVVLLVLAAVVVVILAWRLRHTPARPRQGHRTSGSSQPTQAVGSTTTVERVEPAPPSRTRPEDHHTIQG